MYRNHFSALFNELSRSINEISETFLRCFLNLVENYLEIYSEKYWQRLNTYNVCKHKRSPSLVLSMLFVSTLYQCVSESFYIQIICTEICNVFNEFNDNLVKVDIYCAPYLK